MVERQKAGTDSNTRNNITCFAATAYIHKRETQAPQYVGRFDQRLYIDNCMLSILFGQTIQNGAYACIHSAWLDYFCTCGRDRNSPYAFFAYRLDRLNIGLHVHCARD